MKNLVEIVGDIEPLNIKGDLEVSISSVAINSALVVPGTLFIAIVGALVDGHEFINDAISKGAKVIVHEKDIEFKDGITYIKVADTHDASGKIANAYYNYPSKKLKLIGVTGTNGKTTIATLLHQLFRNLGYKAGMIGTVANKINDEATEAVRTTPDPVTLNATLAQMVDAGCEYCFMEVSSYAVTLKRIAGLEFAGGVFTNLTHDHLDFHNTMEEYAQTKQAFFTSLPEASFALSNLDSDYGEFMIKQTEARKYFYSREQPQPQVGLVAGPKSDLWPDFSGKVQTKLIGDFNQSNVLAVLGTAVLLGIEEKVAREKIKELDPAPGRFVSCESPTGTIGIVDYSHTPDALENVLSTIKKLARQDLATRIITVVGCGGDRDKAKRPVMAKIAYDMSDILILTSDNPRSENPEDILNDMRVGLPDEALSLSNGQKKIHVIADRHEAIQKACAVAKSGDYILLAGKGHENYQEVNGAKTHFDDSEELKNCFDKMV